MAAILSSVRAAVREEVHVAVAAQVPGASRLLQPPQSSSENPSGYVAVSSGDFRHVPILNGMFVGQIVSIQCTWESGHGRLGVTTHLRVTTRLGVTTRLEVTASQAVASLSSATVPSSCYLLSQ